MIKKSVGSKDTAEKLVKNIRCKTSPKYSAEEKIRIVLGTSRDWLFFASCTSACGAKFGSSFENRAAIRRSR